MARTSKLTDKQKRLIRKKYRKIPANRLAKQIHADLKEVEDYVKCIKSHIDPRKKIIFSCISILLPILFLVILEILLNIFRYGGNLDLFISAPADVSNYMRCNPEVGRRYFFIQSTIPSPPKDLFLKEKPKNCYRIFVLGGSTAAGFPYGNNIMFSRILNHRLSDAFPDKRIEVVNTSMSAISSYTFIDFIDEIFENEPDAILIYAGHNEFYGALGVSSMESLGKNRGVVKAYLKLKRFRIFLLIRDFAGGINKLVGKTITNESEVDPTATLMARIVADQTIPLGSHLYDLGKHQFCENLREVLQKAKNAEIPVIVSELVSNIRDQSPFTSIISDTLPPAEDVFRYAKDIEKQKKYKEAKIAYYRAKDLDALRFRATEEFNKIIHEVAAEFDAPVVPMKSYFENASPNGLVGDNLIVDHLHPNIEGYFLVADAFFNTMREHKFIAEYWNPDRIKPSSYYLDNWGLTKLDTLVADISICYLKGSWPFQQKSAPNRSLIDYHPSTKAESLAYEILVNDEMSLELGHLEMAEYYEKQGQTREALAEYKALIHIIPFEVMFYERTADILINEKQYDSALQILYQSQKINETEYANKWIGQILLIQGKITGAIPYLERAREMSSSDSQLLYNLSRAYAYTAQTEKAQETFDRLQKISPDYLTPSKIKELQTLIFYASQDVATYLNKASMLIKNKQFDQALTILQQSLNIKVTPIANKWIGQIMLAENRIQEAIPYLERAREMSLSDPQVLYSLSDAYTKNAQYEKASETFSQLENTHPDFPYLSRLRENLKQASKK